MKTLFKIMRSIIASLLFLILILGITTELVFTTVNLRTKRIRDCIDSKYVLENLLGALPAENERIQNFALEYVDAYMDYIFSKRSYPSIQTLDTKDLTEQEKEIATAVLEQIQKRAELNYETIVKIREISSLATNKSIFLLINVGIIFVFLLLTIVLFSFKKSIGYLGISITASSLMVILIGSIFFSKIKTISNPLIKTLTLSVFDGPFKSVLYKISIFTLIVGLLITFIIFFGEKILKKRQIRTK